MKKILIICTKYPLAENSTWLTRELAEELNNRGYDIDVICIDWTKNSSKQYLKLNNISIYNVPSIEISKSGFLNFIVKWGLSSVYAAFYSHKLVTKKHDLVIGFSPCASSWFLILLGKIFSKKSLLIYWDFFPIHQVQINLIRGKVKEKVLKVFERHLVNLFNYIGCMSAANCAFAEKYFGISANKTFELPIWSEDLILETSLNLDKSEFPFLDDESIYFIFGGQIDYGRGVECILDAARLAHKSNNKVKTIIIGRGRFVDKVIAESKNTDSGIIYSDFIPRNSYLNLVSFCRAGIIATVPNVSVPTYPSKSLDYMKLSLPIIASIEDTTDFGDIIKNAEAGLCCTAGAPGELAASMLQLADNRELAGLMGKNANAFFKATHEVKKVVNNLLDHINEA
ncbi:TPA: glycosyltransferase family 4 protein [Yersinia enterocolitica]|uniref:Glycosyltransferase family 4 protein n=1 Tax=bacterium 19GA11TI05 TaxID=2920688 RepID=A0AAU6TTD8_UNCXX|nr:glycosyltransferase family 4 protein [Citrobacter sp. CRE-46]EKN4766043.1 glycosyltransferase family 4 protein [Yersinia enterocolitica]AWS99529.1 hypothetical protein AN232_31050 [Citrobacter sp. CRE-46]EKN6347565.1 glycosyltransferase WbuB [Yersinia enterocolitica]HDL7347705.1 glycosyltransferase family 4 protein [Yersinia enterocolitica]HDL7412293.1 glycosyltransferase family 4 protein [Yersinia enterocolitica]